MTDMYGVEVLGQERDCLWIRIGLAYPDAGPPGGHQFARLVLWSLTIDLHNHPYIEMFERHTDKVPSYFIRKVHQLTAEREEEVAQDLAAFTSDGKPYEGDTTWTFSIRVRDPAWLQGLEPGRWVMTTAYNSEDEWHDGWGDRNDTDDAKEDLQLCFQVVGEGFKTQEEIPAFLREFWECFYQGRTLPILNYDHMVSDYFLPYLLGDFELSEFEEHEFAGFYPCLGTHNEGGIDAYLCTFCAESRWERMLISTKDWGNADGPLYRVGMFYENVAHFADAMFARAVEQSKEDAILGPMIARDRAHARAWFAARGVQGSWSQKDAFVTFMECLLSPKASEEIVLAVLQEFFDDFAYATIRNDVERTWALRLLRQHAPLVRAHLWKESNLGRIFAEELRWCSCIVMLLELTDEDITQIWEVLKHPPREYDDYVPLFFALLRTQGLDALPGILQAIQNFPDAYDSPVFYALSIHDVVSVHEDMGLPAFLHLDVLQEAADRLCNE